MEIIYFLSSSLGASFIWSFEEIFTPTRNFIAKYFGKLRKPFLCSECSSFWIGFIFSFLFNPFFNYVPLYILSNILCGLSNYLFFKIIKKYLYE